MQNPVKTVNDQSSIVFGIVSIALGLCTVLATLLTILLLPCGVVQILLGVAGVVFGFLAFTRGRNANVQPGKVTGMIGIVVSALATLIPIGYFIFIVLLYAGLFAFGQGSR
jgi:uncharacterized membrane protein HdeD (DUF308 family)